MADWHAINGLGNRQKFCRTSVNEAALKISREESGAMHVSRNYLPFDYLVIPFMPITGSEDFQSGKWEFNHNIEHSNTINKHSVIHIVSLKISISNSAFHSMGKTVLSFDETVRERLRDSVTLLDEECRGIWQTETAEMLKRTAERGPLHQPLSQIYDPLNDFDWQMMMHQSIKPVWDIGYNLSLNINFRTTDLIIWFSTNNSQVATKYKLVIGEELTVNFN